MKTNRWDNSRLLTCYGFSFRGTQTKGGVVAIFNSTAKIAYQDSFLAIEAARSFTAQNVVGVLQYLFAVRSTPQHIRGDNGPEFVARTVCRWLNQADVKTLFIAKVSPWENGYVESFNGKLRDDLLNRKIFLSLAEARWVIDRGDWITITIAPTVH